MTEPAAEGATEPAADGATELVEGGAPRPARARATEYGERHATGSGERHATGSGERRATESTAPRVVLYGRVGCHLCDEAREVVARVCDEAGVPWAEVDVDDPPEPGVPDLFELYGERVPVVAVDGVDVAQWRVSERALRAALAAGPAGPVA